MKNNILIAILIVTSLFVVGINDVSAKECSNVFPAPYMYQVTPPRKGEVVSLNTAYGTCQGSNTEAWFSNPRTLPNSWTYSEGVIWMDLWEEDPPGNNDEYVKEYAARISNKTIWQFLLVDTITEGNIDSAGDPTCELYLNFYSSGQQGLTIDKTLFDYKICMN